MLFRSNDTATTEIYTLSLPTLFRSVRHSRAGKDVVLDLLGPGGIFGGVAVIEKRPYPAAAQAVEATTVLKIPAEALTAASERHPDLIKEMALMIGRRLR